MKDFKKLSKLLLKRNKIWLVLISILTLVVFSSSVNGVKNVIIYDTSKKLVEIEMLYKKEITKEHLKPFTNFERSYYLKTLKEKYPERLPKDFNKEYNAYYDELRKIFKSQPFDFYETKEQDYFNQIGNNPYSVLDGYIGLNNYNSNLVTSLRDGEVKVKNDFLKGDITIFLFIVLTGFLFTSMEHMTPFYEFTRMYPWSQRKNYFMKLFLIILITILMYMITSVIYYFIWKNSYVGEIISFSGIWKSWLLLLIKYLVFAILVVTTGTLAGNIIGHGGLMIIAIFGINLVKQNIMGIKELFVNISSYDLVFKFENYIKDTPYQAFYNPLSSFSSDSISVISGLLALGLFYLIIGYIFSNKVKGENSGYLVTIKPVKILANVLAVFTTTFLLTSITNLFYIETNFSLIKIGIFALIFFITYKVYKVLFNIKLGV